MKSWRFIAPAMSWVEHNIRTNQWFTMPKLHLYLENISLQYLEVSTRRIWIWTQRFHAPGSTLAFALGRLLVLRQKSWVQNTSEPALYFWKFLLQTNECLFQQLTKLLSIAARRKLPCMLDVLLASGWLSVREVDPITLPNKSIICHAGS
jgi:hypothetical protein